MVIAVDNAVHTNSPRCVRHTAYMWSINTDPDAARNQSTNDSVCGASGALFIF